MNTLSFRDPISKVYKDGNSIFRKLNNDDYNFFRKLEREDFFKKIIIDNKVQSFSLVDDESKIMTHEFIKNFTVSNEMSSYQLYLSGIHTLDLLIECLENGYCLKDASAWNVVFFEGKPLFLDVGSFEEWNGNRVWLAYGQFVRHYITPLIINKETGIKTSFLFNNHIDGIDPLMAKKILGIKKFKSWMNFEFIYLPSLFERKKLNNNFKENKNSNDKDFNLSIILRIIKRLKKKLSFLEPKNDSFWSRYTGEREHYTDEDIEIKKKILLEFIKDKRGNLLDIGCNTGEFLNLTLANKNINSYGIDYDEECINFTQKKFSKKKVNLSCINITNPPNSIGWVNSETQSYIDKNELFYDIVIFFGIIHHLTATHRIPLTEIFLLLNKLTKNHVVLEFVNSNDKKFLELAGKNIDLYKNFNQKNFEQELSKYFKIEKKIDYKQNKNRIVYILKKNSN